MFFPHLYEHENKRNIHARSSSAARLATPCLVTTRRGLQEWAEPMSNFCHALRVYERSLGSWKVFAVVDNEYERLSCAYITEVAPLQRDTSEGPLPLATQFQSLRCCCLPHPGLRRAPRVIVSALRMLGFMSYKQLHLVSILDVFTSSSYMKTMFTFSLSDCMTCCIFAILVMLYLVFLLIK